MAYSAKTPFLHVANGTCTTSLIEAAAIPGARSIWADPLYEGPVPANLGDDELLQLRARFLAEPMESSRADIVNGLREWRTVIDDHRAYSELVLWFEHDLFDQLNLIQILSWIRTRRPTPRVVSLVSVGSFPGHPKFKGLGELKPSELASLLETRQPVGEAQYSLAERAWQSFREPTPEALDTLRQADTEALPYLAAAVTRFLQEYPWTTDGLSRTERRLLEVADAGQIALSAAFPRMHDGEGFYYITDSSIVTLAESLSRTSPPLLTLFPGLNADSEVLQGSVAITDTGRAVLTGRQDRIALCGIDRWLGGVHLQNDSDLWRWDDGRHRIAKQRTPRIGDRR